MSLLFQSKTLEEVKKSFLRAKWQADKARQEEAQDKLDLYMDDYEELVDTALRSLFVPANYDRLKWHLNQSQNLLKRVINEISIIYKTPAERQAIIGEKQDARYEELKELINYDVMWQKINRYTNLLNECFIKVGEREGEIVYDIITPNIYSVVQNELDPTKIDALIYQVTNINTVGDDIIHYHYWSVEGDYFIYDESYKIIEEVYEGDSPYKNEKGEFILPGITIHRTEPDSQYFDQDTGRDLYNAALLTSVKMTLFDYYQKVASFKQPYLIGDAIKVPAQMVSDPLTFLTASGEGAKIGVLDLQINFEAYAKAIEFHINGTIANYGISADMFNLHVSEMSGRALKIRNQGLLERREEQIPTYRKAERELFEVTRIVNNAEGFTEISDNAEFQVDFAELDFPEEPEAELRLDIQKLNYGLISRGEFYKKYNPDYQDEKKAEERYDENLEDLEKAKGSSTTLDDALNAALNIDKQQSARGEEE